MKALMDEVERHRKAHGGASARWVFGADTWPLVREDCAMRFTGAGRYAEAFRMRALEAPVRGMEVFGYPVARLSFESGALRLESVEPAFKRSLNSDISPDKSPVVFPDGRA